MNSVQTIVGRKGRFQPKPIENYRSVKHWFAGLTKRSVSNYKLQMSRFCEFTKQNPDQLFRLAKKDRIEAHAWAKRFYEHLRTTSDLANGTRYHAYMAVRSFFSINEVQLGKRPSQYQLRPEYDSGRLLTIKEVFDLVRSAQYLRNRTILTFLVQSGQRTGVLSALTYGHLRRELEQGVTPLVIHINAGLVDIDKNSANKVGTTYRFAVGKESVDLVRRMITQRQARGEPIDDDSWLWRSNSEIIEKTPEKGRYPVPAAQDQRGTPLSSKSLWYIIHDAIEKTGIQVQQSKAKINVSGRKQVRYEVYPHMFRRFWKHQMREGSITDNDLLRYMMGQSAHDTSTYDRFDTEYVRRQYAKAEPFLSVLTGPETRPVASQGSESVVRSSTGGCQRIVTEPELDTLLQSGWKYVDTLPSGRIIIEDFSNSSPVAQH